MKEWNEIYRDLLAAQNAIAEAIAAAKTLHERDTRFMDEIKEKENEYRRRADSYEQALVEQQARIAALEAQLDKQQAYIDRVDGEAKIAALEAQLDKGWIPPQEPPPENTYVEMIVKGHYHWQFDEWSVLPIDEQLISDYVMGWRNDPEEPWKIK